MDEFYVECPNCGEHEYNPDTQFCHSCFYDNNDYELVSDGFEESDYND